MSDQSNLASEQLWQSLRRGKKDALGKLYQLHYQPLVAYAQKLGEDVSLSQDVIQDLFVHLWKKHKELPSVRNVKMYLLKSIRNRTIRALQQNGRWVSQEKVPPPTTIPVEEELIMVEWKNEQLLKLHYHMGQLPLRQREVLHLKFFQGLTTDETAQVLGVKNQSVANLLRRAILNLQARFQSSSTRPPLREDSMMS